MQLFSNLHVFVTITDRSIRYFVCPYNKPEQVADYGEVIFDVSMIEDGRIVNEEQLMLTLKMLIEQKKWRRRKLSFIVPDSFVVMRFEKIPSQLNKEEATSYIKLQLEGSIRLPFKKPVIDYQCLQEGDKENDILLFAYPSERLLPYYHLFDQLRLQPVVADVSYLSVYRSYVKQDLFRKGEHLLMIQWNKVDLVLTVFHDHLPRFSRHIHFANAFQAWEKDQVKHQLVWRQSTTATETFIEEQLLTIERFIDFYQYSVMNGLEQVTDLLVVGDFPDMEQLKQQLRDRLALPIKNFHLTNHLPLDYAALYGLGLKGASFD
ncbi:type IV pilus biogenesis protein PilM [Amphibacillus jilinensis]|uniref:type IV pilus biogenesis protein PilM n=1 Tax=Amphibacillus jilinensis TaxID=1216008 RepID=UPI0002D3DAB0|nr:pilus assembly protein PilM [Amphibacillus jilinensis]